MKYIKKFFYSLGFLCFGLCLMDILIGYLVDEGVFSLSMLIGVENILTFIFKSIIFIFLITIFFILIFLFGSIMCDICVMIKHSWICMIFVERAITKRSLKRLKKSNLVLFLLGEYLSDYKFDTRNELEREVKKYKYLLSDGISNTIFWIVESRILFFWSNKEERAILKQVLKENKEKLDRVDFNKVKRVIRKLNYSDPYWEGESEHTTISRDYKYNDENYYNYFSKSPIVPESAIFDEFTVEIEGRMLNEMIEVVDNPEEEFPLYVDPGERIQQYYKNMK